MIRAIWFVITVGLLTVWHGGVTILAALFRVPQKPGGIYDRMSRGWGRNLLRANGLKDVTVTGLECLPPGQPCVYVSNHVSLVDIWVLLAVLPGTVRFLAKRELMRVPVFGWAMASAGHIPIDRRKLQSAFGAYETAAGMVRSGTSAIIFGEGTRSRDGRMLPLKKGPFVLGIKAGVPVVPIYISGTWEILPPGRVAPRPGPIGVALGPPLSTAGLKEEDRDALAARCTGAMQSLRDHVDGDLGPG